MNIYRHMKTWPSFLKTISKNFATVCPTFWKHTWRQRLHIYTDHHHGYIICLSSKYAILFVLPNWTFAAFGLYIAEEVHQSQLRYAPIKIVEIKKKRLEKNKYVYID